MFKVKCKKGLIDISECSITIETQGPVMPYDNFPELHNLVATDSRTEKKTIIAQFNQKRLAEFAYDEITNAFKNNKSYVDITQTENIDQNTEEPE